MKTIQLTDSQVKLLFHFLDDLSEHMSNAGCNDLPEHLREMMEPEGKAIEQEYAVFNNPDEPEGPSWPISDICLLHWLKSKINEQL